MPARVSYHIPQGDPCTRCHQPRAAHRVEHAPQGDPCRICLCAASQHRPQRERIDTRKGRIDTRKGRGNRQRTRKPTEEFFLGIDGEGCGRDDHKYVMMGRAGVNGTHRATIEAKPGERLSSEQCLQFIIDCPQNSKIFAFAFSYDITHILRDLPDGAIYTLLRPELRIPKNAHLLPPRKRGPQPIKWRGFSINLISRKLTVSQGKRRKVVWDIFAFFQSSFVKACERWQVGTADELSLMSSLKNRRHDFDKLWRENSSSVREYCIDECAKMAELAEKLVKAHKDAGMILRSYFGAGSSASCILKGWGIDQEVREAPERLKEKVAQAFFGGRFENSRIGECRGLWGYDISSAYPYQIQTLPCLSCGTWAHTTDIQDVESSHMSLVRYSLPAPKKRESWGPLPFRNTDGSIVFPTQSGGGWVWSSEFLAAKKLFPRLRFHEAHTYHTTCKCQPFGEIPDLYNLRLSLGKEGAGIVIKLAMNSLYGKTAQSQGVDPPFQSWVWAGMITAGTRAQLLDLMACHESLDSVVMVATDGLYSTECIATPKPRETGTGATGKPLGGWERSEKPVDMFAARPGIYFPLVIGEGESDKVRARGVGRGTMVQQFQTAIDAFHADKMLVNLANVTRFNGAKNTISWGKTSGYKRSPTYGQWTTKGIDMSFDPMPKRGTIRKDGSLSLRSFPGMESLPYDPATISPEDLALKISQADLHEQPDGMDWSDYDSDP